MGTVYCLRWKCGTTVYGTPLYKVGVVDGGFEAHGEKMVKHMNRYYFDDIDGQKDASQKIIDFMLVTHPDQDHTNGLKKILKNLTVNKIFMNRPWLYVEDLFDKVDDGRITKDSLYRRLREKYKTIADIEEIAEAQGIPIYEAFEGTCIDNKLLVLSPSKQFYLNLLIESEKTPLQKDAALQQGRMFTILAKAVKAYVLDILETWDIETIREDEKTTAENETSVVVRGIIDGSGFILTGDAGIRALNKALDYMDWIGEDVLKVVSFYQIPHHGGRHNVSPSLLNRMLGEKVKTGEVTGKTAYASVAKDSDHPLKMVTNAFIRRGVKVYKTEGNIICYQNGKMPNRNWVKMKEVEFSNYVEGWED